jgi:hypothetical protein
MNQVSVLKQLAWRAEIATLARFELLHRNDVYLNRRASIPSFFFGSKSPGPTAI